MPLEELLAMYGYGGEPQETKSSSEEEILSNQDLTLDKDEIARDLLKNDDNDRETSVTDLLDSVEVPSQTVRSSKRESLAGVLSCLDQDMEAQSLYLAIRLCKTNWAHAFYTYKMNSTENVH